MKNNRGDFAPLNLVLGGHIMGRRFSKKFVWGSRNSETLDGTDQNNLIFGFRGNDTINGNGGNDSAEELFGHVAARV